VYLQLLTVCILILVAAFAYFQILQPLIRGTPLFPYFSEGEKLEGEIEKEAEGISVQKKEKKLDKLKEQRQQSDAEEGQ